MTGLTVIHSTFYPHALPHIHTHTHMHFHNRCRKVTVMGGVVRWFCLLLGDAGQAAGEPMDQEQFQDADEVDEPEWAAYMCETEEETAYASDVQHAPWRACVGLSERKEVHGVYEQKTSRWEKLFCLWGICASKLLSKIKSWWGNPRHNRFLFFLCFSFSHVNSCSPGALIERKKRYTCK